MLLVTQIAICAVLVTSSLVAVRGLVRSLDSSYGFQPRNAMLVESDLHMAGYTGERVPQMEQRMLDAVAAIPGVTAVGYISQLPLSLSGSDSYVFTDSTTDFRPTNYAADAMDYDISPGYLEAAGTRLLAGRDLTASDQSKAPKVALVNRRFAQKVFGSVDKAIGGHFKYWGGQRAEVVGVVEDGKYRTLTEDQQPAMFFSFLQQPSSGTWLVVQSRRSPQETAGALESALHGLDSGLPFVIRTWTEEMDSALFAARVATVALGDTRITGRNAGGYGYLRHGVIRGKQAAARVGNSRGFGRSATGNPACIAGTRLSPAGCRLGCRPGAGSAGDTRVVVHRLPGHAQGSAGAGRGKRDHASVGRGGGVDSSASGTGRGSAGPAARRIAAVPEKDAVHSGPEGACSLRLRVTGYRPLNNRSAVNTTFWSGTRSTMSVPEWPGYDSNTAVSRPRSIERGGFAGSIGRFGRPSTLALAMPKIWVIAFRSLCARVRSKSDFASSGPQCVTLYGPKA